MSERIEAEAEDLVRKGGGWRELHVKLNNKAYTMMDTKYNLVDTHTHPQMGQYDADRDEVVERALENNVQMICVGVDLESSRQAVELAKAHAGIWAAVGLHPNDNLDEDYNQAPYERLALHSKVVAIGEIGLDYYRTPDVSQQEFQKQRFIQQLELAVELEKPVIVHCREAHADMQTILSGFSGKLTGVIHSFTGTLADAERYIDLGFYLGFNGIITFARQYDEIITSVPLDRILLETDAPYLTPEPFRGKRNESLYLPYIAEQLAKLRDISVEEVAQQTTANSTTLFGLE